MATTGTLFEQISELLQQEAEIMNADFGLAMQLFGAPVDDDGKVEEGGKRGFRVITHTTELDSQGTEENQVYSSEKELVKLGLEAHTDEERKEINRMIEELRASDAALLKSAKEEVKEGKRKGNVRKALALHIKADLKEKEMELVRKGLELDPVVDEYEQESVNTEIEELRALNKGCMADITDKEMHANFIERELDESSPELLGFAFDKIGWSRLFDEVEPDEVEPDEVQFKKEKLEDRNWLHLTAQARKREERFEWLKVKIRNAYDNAMRLKVLGYTVIFREEMSKFVALERKIWEARNYSFAHVLLDHLEPKSKGMAWWMKQRTYLSRKKNSQTYKVYNESRGLTFEQANVLIEGWKIMKAKLDAPKG